MEWIRSDTDARKELLLALSHLVYASEPITFDIKGDYTPKDSQEHSRSLSREGLPPFGGPLTSSMRMIHWIHCNTTNNGA
ncbi:hypothetical protein HPP92_007191 [Vanilla planifolia]|uniref:Uncharacterized protein n=1 Tax=Vanilla planifolia TaxID=51239 RepID=A0A835V965_VANPL|nr:hypothetical protein HPP92_007191 [Vanilla planifolia]